MKHNRRSTKKINDLPSLFSEEEIYGDTPSAEPIVIAPALPKPDEPDEPRLSREFLQRKKKLRFISFGSGSSGNSAYVGTSDCGILIDAGVDNKFVLAELQRNGINPDTIRGILLTHDHGDHVKYAYALVRRQPEVNRTDGSRSGWRIFATPRTIEGILRRHNLSSRIRDYHTPIYKEHEYVFGDMRVTPFETSHDGTDNVGFFITMGDARLAICTDLGAVTERADFYLRQATSMVFESNYDRNMLIHGRYTEHLKARIRSDIGHMDNVDSARYVADSYRPSLRHIFLCHISKENNTPQLALDTMLGALGQIGVKPALTPSAIPPGTVYVTALPRYESSELYIIN